MLEDAGSETREWPELGYDRTIPRSVGFVIRNSPCGSLARVISARCTSLETGHSRQLRPGQHVLPPCFP